MSTPASHTTLNASSLGAPDRGTLVLIGGALDEDPSILQRIISLAKDSRADRTDTSPARIAIFTTASEPAASAGVASAAEEENDEADGRYYVELFGRHGALGIPIPIGVSTEPSFPGATYLRGNAHSAEIAAAVRSSDGIFLGGGDQTHYLLALFESATAGTPPFEARSDTAVMTAMRELLHRGGVVAGTSAGLAVQQAAPMVSGGTSREAWLHGASAGYADDERLRYIPAGGLGFFAEGLLDSHFNEWGRVARAVRLSHATKQRLAIGVDEHTALIYSPLTRSGEVIGTGGVSVLDSSEAAFAEGTNGPGIIDVRWHHYTAGDRYDFARGEASRSNEMRAQPGEDSAPSVAQDIWSEAHGLALLHLAQALLRSPDRLATGESAEADNTRFRVTLLRDERTSWNTAGGFAELRLSITPIPPSA